MDGSTLSAFIFISGFSCVLSAAVNITISNVTSDDSVTFTCMYSVNPGDMVTYLDLSRMTSEDDRWKEVAFYKVQGGAVETGFGIVGKTLENRADLSDTENSLVLKLNDVTCDDHARYKCQIRLKVDPRDYILDAKYLVLKDEDGEVCGAMATLYSLSTLLSVLCLSLVLS